MSEIRWTVPQEAAISTGNKNILVAAAAGSGKTAVLVERVIRLIIEKNVDLDSLIVMTFTRAAAAQMRKKIYKAIREKLADDPENEHLKRQIFKVNTAKICTIDSLCLDIVRENFQYIDVDPGFSMADEAEIAMIKKDIIKQLIELKYEEAEDDFLELAAYYTDKNDNKLEELVLTLFNFAQSHPEPEKWLMDLRLPYSNALTEDGKPDPEGKGWISDLGEVIENKLLEVKEMAKTGLSISLLPSGPYKYEDIFQELIDFIDGLEGKDFYSKKYEIEGFTGGWKRLPSFGKNDTVDDALKELAQTLRKDIKKVLQELEKTFFYQNFEDSLKDMYECRNVVFALTKLTLDFSAAFMAVKNERKILDFSDVAHYALKVLIKYDENGSIIRKNSMAEYTETANAMAEGIYEIIVDEYQDTNMLQEELILALSGFRFGRPNVFMVGDVKQSIYGFRMACPELFIEKYNRYGNGFKSNERIILDSNFRSRKEIIDFTNFIFEQAMIPEVGGIDYKDGNGLTCGADYPEGEKDEFIPEVLMIQGKSELSTAAESFFIAKKIEEIVNTGRVYDRDKKEYRKANYSDIAIISRGADNPQLEKVLNERAIPVEKSTNRGFFESFEIKLTLNLLTIIDNPLQDIPFVAVLKSPIVGATADDLAEIKIAKGKYQKSFYEATIKHGKFIWFIDKLKEWHKRSIYMTMSDFIEYVMDDSNLYNCLIAMPMGEVRKANIDLLKSSTINYSKSSYSGLYNFIRYIEEIKKADIDYGNATAGGTDNSVKMMTIHKSKGLEFPYVFIAGCGKNYNKTDMGKSILLDRESGIGVEKRDVEKRIIKKTLFMEMLKERMKENQYAEEMRVFYVALTRAKEKLFITGGNTNLSSAIEKQWAFETLNREERLSQPKIMKAGSYLFLTGLALARHKDGALISEIGGMGQDSTNPLYNKECAFKLDIVECTKIDQDMEVEAVDNFVMQKKLEEGIYLNSDEGTVKNIEESLGFEYPYSEATKTIARVSPSSFEGTDTEHENSNEEKTKKYYKTGSTNAAERGNAYHKVFELLDYSDTEDLEGQILKMAEGGRMPEEYAKLVEWVRIEKFLKTPIGGRMKAAALDGKLKREQQFVCGFEENGELRLMQGIIDAFFEETDGAGNTYAVLVDYKTDKNEDEQHYIDAYKAQLKAYANTIEKALGMEVREVFIYSVELGRTIKL